MVFDSLGKQDKADFYLNKNQDIGKSGDFWVLEKTERELEVRIWRNEFKFGGVNDK